MAYKLTPTSETLNKNWVKGALALKYTKEGLEDNIANALFDLQQTFLSGICTLLDISEAKCTNCTTTQICVENKPCPNGICNILLKNISSHYSYGTPRWAYTDASNWCTNYFEIAKCYLPMGYANATSVKDLDLNGLIHLAIHCQDIQSHFEADISTPTGILSKVRKFRNKLMHSASFTLTQEELEEHIDLMISVLQDKKELAQDQIAQESVDKLAKLKDEKVQPSNDETTKIQQETTLEQKKIENCKNALEMFKPQLVNQMKPETVIAKLYETEWLPFETLDHIKSLSQVSEKNTRLIETVLQKNDIDVYNEFKACLRDSGHKDLADGLDKREKELNEAASVPSIVPSGNRRHADEKTKEISSHSSPGSDYDVVGGKNLDKEICYGTVLGNIVGIQYYKGIVNKNEMVTLEREPTKKYDNNSIRVLNVGNVQLGHIKRELAKLLAFIMDTNLARLEARVGNPELERLSVNLTLTLWGKPWNQQEVLGLLINNGFYPTGYTVPGEMGGVRGTSDRKPERICGGQERLQDTKEDDMPKLTQIDNHKDLRDLCKQHGRKSQEIVEVCKRISMDILVCSMSFKDVLPMYKPADPDSIIFVVFCEPESNRSAELSITVQRFDIKYCTIGEYSNEDTVMFSKSEEADRTKLTDMLRKSSSHFMKKHSNLNIITASPVKSQGFPLKNDSSERKPCIVFYVCLKGYIPIQEEEFPRRIGSYETDVREGAFTLYNVPEPYLPRLKTGCSIGENDRNVRFGGSYGTLGAFVDLEDGNVGCITSAHVLLSKENLIACKNKGKQNDFSHSSTIYQPAPLLVTIEDKKAFGRVTSGVYKTGGEGDTGVEVGLITITDQTRYPEDGRFPMVAEGYTDENQLNYTSGSVLPGIPDSQCTFYKYGATTGLTRGAFNLHASAVRTTGNLDVWGNCELHNQIEVCTVGDKPFAKPGDSGSLVLLSQNNNLHAVGIVTGGTSDFTKFYITPIWEVLTALRLPLQLKSFLVYSPMGTDGHSYINTSLSSEIGAMKQSIETVKSDYANEIKTVNTKVDTIDSDMKKGFNEILKKMNENNMNRACVLQ